MTTPAFPTESGTLTLQGPVGPLEVAVDLPEGEATPRPVTAIICHPLSTEGGTMHNKVVTMVARALRDLGVTTVRFNFRSVGASAGEFDHGNGEQDDLRTVAAWVREQRPDHEMWLAGFSFGAFVSLLPGRDGLVHISKLGKGKRINKVEDVVNVGSKLRVEIADIDDRGKISLVPVDDDAAAEAPAEAATADA